MSTSDYQPTADTGQPTYLQAVAALAQDAPYQDSDLTDREIDRIADAYGITPLAVEQDMIRQFTLTLGSDHCADHDDDIWF